MDFTHFDVEVRRHVLIATFNRPERRNSITMAKIIELGRLFDWADEDDDVRVVILTGQGPSFSAGSDLNEGFIGPDVDLTDAQRSYVAAIGSIDGVMRDGGGWVTLRIARSLKPVIVAFNGSAVGMGLTMALPADIRLAADTARFGLVFTRRGITPEACSSWFLPRIVGMARAAEWIMTGRIFDAYEAHQAGLVSHIVPQGELLKAALNIANEIAELGSPVALAAARRMLWSMLSAASPWDAHAVESQVLFDMANSPDGVEGIASFLEKRPPSFPLKVSADVPKAVPSWPDPPAAFSHQA